MCLWLFGLYRGLLLPNYMGILISQYKDPYKPTRIQWESRRVFLRSSFVEIYHSNQPNVGNSMPYMDAMIWDIKLRELLLNWRR